MEFQLRTTSPNDSAAVRSVRPCNLSHPLRLTRARRRKFTSIGRRIYPLHRRRFPQSVRYLCSKVQGEQVRIFCGPHLYGYPSFSPFRPKRYIVRDFQYSADQIEKEREELHTADTAEKELWASSPP